MKKDIPVPLVVGITVILIALAGFFIWKSTEPAPIPGGKKLPGYSDELPQYIQDAKDGKKINPEDLPNAPKAVDANGNPTNPMANPAANPN